jgi:hypothetical protein
MLRTRRYAPWLAVVNGHDSAALQATAATLAEAPEALWWLVGVRWGEDTSRPLVHASIMLPDLPMDLLEDIPDSFAMGLGTVLGGHWGRQEDPAPLNLPERWRASFDAGYQRGILERWD